MVAELGDLGGDRPQPGHLARKLLAPSKPLQPLSALRSNGDIVGADTRLGGPDGRARAVPL